MNMPTVCSIGIIIGAFIGFFVTVNADAVVPSSLLGAGYKEISQMKKECEIYLERAYKCSAKIEFVADREKDN